MARFGRSAGAGRSHTRGLVGARRSGETQGRLRWLPASALPDETVGSPPDETVGSLPDKTVGSPQDDALGEPPARAEVGDPAEQRTVDTAARGSTVQAKPWEEWWFPAPADD